MSEPVVGRTLNSFGGLSPGQTTSAELKQQGACIPTTAPDGGKLSECSNPAPASKGFRMVEASSQ
ncbi:MAG: hypothetical protein LKF64_10300 [Alcaligenes faecalis]|uniref:hypothetical protein n=1 Tax=Alcaligenes TaxID=507 RepID=UPI002227C4B7|nr:hypothetical protein [Alcaligenes sp. SMD-FA]MCH4225379.1 hypothetical protein [Alcaligenes faecalis]UYY87651.1 hypothetical protein OKX01_01680 [Alcaligenes sp. SMD-FA]